MPIRPRVAGLAVGVVRMVELVDLPVLDAQVTLGTLSRPVSGIGVARATEAVQSLMHESPTDGGMTL